MTQLFKVCGLLAVLIAAFAPIAGASATDKLRGYKDKDFGFSFSYPTSWSEQPGLGRNTRVVITAPPGSNVPEANCNVIVRSIPGTLNQSQEQLNHDLDGKEFENDYWLRDMPKNTRVFDSRKITLGSNAARTAVIDYSATEQGYTGYATQLHLITLTPGFFYGMTCGSQGDTPAEGRAGFIYWKATFGRIIQSLKVPAKK